jgi:hypothetical protein
MQMDTDNLNLPGQQANTKTNSINEHCHQETVENIFATPFQAES